MMDRQVCADGRNPDPISTHGKTPEEAKAIELQGWHYPRYRAGRLFPIIVHGDTQGADVLCHSLTDWLLDMELIQSNHAYMFDRSIG